VLHVVKQVYERFGEGDIDGFLGLCDDNIEWVVNGPSDLEHGRAFSGTAGVREFLAILDRTWVFDPLTSLECVAAGDKVLVLGEASGTDKASGRTFRNRWAHVFTVRGGRIVTFRKFNRHYLGKDPLTMSWR